MSNCSGVLGIYSRGVLVQGLCAGVIKPISSEMKKPELLVPENVADLAVVVVTACVEPVAEPVVSARSAVSFSARAASPC